jgi:hypothetical protein
MRIRDTRDRQEVEAIRRWSIAERIAGRVEEIADWEPRSPHYNSCFRESSTGRQWVIYLSDHAYGGEVRLLGTGTLGNLAPT